MQYYSRAYNTTGRKRSGVFTPTPAKRVRLTPVSQRTHITNTQGSMRFTPRRSGRKVAMTNLRRRLLRTPRRVRMRRNAGAYGAANSKSSGFIYTPQIVKASRKSKVTKKGVQIVLERGGVLDAGANTTTAGNTVAIGHANCPLVLAENMLWRAIVKQLFIKAGALTTMSNFEEAIGGLAGGIIRVRYRLNPDSAFTQFTYTTLVTDSLETISKKLWEQFIDPTILGGSNNNLEFFDIRLGGPNYSDVVLNLRKAVFHFYGKSTLKVQNRTVQDTTDDEESVDNVPLHGKAYFGKGSGTSAFTHDASYSIAASGFHTDVEFGALAKVPTEKWYQEPVPPSHFIRVLKSGKVHLDPGHIKTSVLDGRFKVSVNQFYKMLAIEITLSAGLPTENYHRRSNLGHYRFMILEKMINAVVGTTTNSIKCAWEVNLRMGGYITTSNETETAQLNDLANLATEA